MKKVLFLAGIVFLMLTVSVCAKEASREGFYETDAGIIFGYKDSDAESYAAERGFRFVDIETIKADTYENCTTLVYDNTAWVWMDAKLRSKIYDVKDACVTRYIGSNENVILVVDKFSDLVESRYRNAASVTSKTVMENVHSIKKEDGRIYIQTKDGKVFERVYSNNKAENIPCEEKVFENTSISVYVDGKSVLSDCEPYIKNDRTMVPMRAIFEALGASVNWYQDEKIATGTKGEVDVAIKIGDKVLYKNGEPIVLDATAEIKNNRTMVPVRAISEAFGCSVEWEDATKSVIVEAVDRAWDYTYLADEADKATYYWYTSALSVAVSGKTADKATIKRLLQFVADSSLTKKEYDGGWYESSDRRSFSIFVKGSIISVEIGKEDILIDAMGKISCYEVKDMTAFQNGIRQIFGMDDKDKTESVFYKHFGADIKDEIAYFQVIDKSIENESFVMTVNEIAGNAENMYVTISLKAKDEADKVYLTPNGVYGQVDFDIHSPGVIAEKVYASTKWKWIDKEGRKVFLYRIKRSNYSNIERIRVNSSAMMGEDIYFDTENIDE